MLMYGARIQRNQIKNLNRNVIVVASKCGSKYSTAEDWYNHQISNLLHKKNNENKTMEKCKKQ